MKRILFIFPWFCRYNSAIGKHFQIFLDCVSEAGVYPVIVGLDGQDTYTGQHDFIPIKEIPSKLSAALGRRIFPDIINQPDIYNFSLRKRLVKKVLRVVDISKIDAIHSVSFPCSSHLMAYDIVKKTSKPWIAQFYDPWTDNPYRKISTTYFKNKDLLNERTVANNATVLIHTNDYIMQIWNQRYNDIGGKSFVLPMSFERHIYEGASNVVQKERTSKVVISYIGKLFFDRNLDDVVAAIKKMKTTIPDLCRKIEIRIIGQTTKHDLLNIKNNGCEDCFNIIGYVDRKVLDEYYKASDVFLVIDSPQKENNIFFPSKLLDYFVYQRKILGITPTVGVTSQLINESGNIAVENGNIDALCSVLTTFISNKSSLNEFDHSYYKNFSPEKLTEKYSKILSRI